MFLLKKALKDPNTAEASISKVLPISEHSSSCDASECHNRYSASCFKLSPDGANTPLWETASVPDLHVLVSSGKTDWQRDPFDAPGTILEHVSKTIKGPIARDFKFDTMLSTTSLALNEQEFAAYSNQEKCDVLLMPYFVWIRGITKENCEAVFKEVIGSFLSGKAIAAEFRGCAITKDESKSFVLLCSHRTRDKKCGITAPIMKKEFDSQLRDLELYRDPGDDRPGGVQVVFVNHVGGHKYAANVLIYNHGGEAVWFARCTPLNVKPILDETVLQGKVFPALVRGVKNFDVTW
ncbi:hypothetical protein OGAPHI_005219 [Ogataea philodendri]|uniref:Actin patches distal protein 1 n=1 Tax=Ogataea philodendri TaxID=1378263 RepID=A0A9P8T3H5_9ASCO|nr:uncharacterized protein OGAPHI_005219 [Ogataea philodendri]KAH3663816.1 hypothetical protein OGAPHI_005219 [Ogataea philodendri]